MQDSIRRDFFVFLQRQKEVVAMLTKNEIKYIQSLAQKKHRDKDNVFLAEGPKVIGEIIGLCACKMLCGTKHFIDTHPEFQQHNIREITEKELQQASLLKTPQEALAIFEKPAEGVSTASGLSLALDCLQDPGNLGTIIRLADWFGIDALFCSMNTADAYAPKVIQATMGAIARVKIHYVDLPRFLSQQKVPIYGTFLEGDNIYQKDLQQKAIIVMGNEGNGISKEVEQLVTEKLFIPNYPTDHNTVESLNVAIATAITCAAFRQKA